MKMGDMFDSMDMGKGDSSKMSADYKLKEVVKGIKEVAAMMGGGMNEAMEKVQAMCGDQQQDDNADITDDGESIDEQSPAKSGKKAIVIAMLKNKKAKDGY